MKSNGSWFLCPWCEAVCDTEDEAQTHMSDCDVGPDLDMGFGPEDDI